jgi:glycosyltransferase involved in cell wall biosynthesis
MRIGLIIYGSLKTLTGGYLYDRIVVQGLERLGHEVEVISLTSGSYFRRLGHGFSSGLSRRLLAGRFDILLEDELCHPSLFLINQRLRRRGGPPVVAIVHHIFCREPRPDWQNSFLALIERRYLASVDGFIFNSETTRRTVTALVGNHQPQIIAYPAGDRFGSPLSPERISQRASQPGPLELLFLGIIIPRKGLLPLLSALAGVDRALWRLTVVGGLNFDPAHTAEVRQHIQQLGLADSVRFIGACGDDELVEILSVSHVFCMPYAYEGFGIAILEAMAFGLPAIGSLEGAANETISHGHNGFLLAPDDRTGLAQLLIKLQHNRQELLRLSLAARATYASRPCWQDNVAAINGFLKKMTNRQGIETIVEPLRSTENAAPRDKRGAG